jgi:hypothetical protein
MQFISQPVNEAASLLATLVMKNPEEPASQEKILEILSPLSEDQRVALLIKISSAQREASRVYQVAMSNNQGISAVIWGITSAALGEIAEIITADLPECSDPDGARRLGEWMASEAKRYLVLKQNATLILP